jgi:hypothetical protein
MIAKRLFLVLAASAVLLLQFADCMSAVAPDQQAMKCCGSMPCTPANKTHDCCKMMVSGRTPGVLPAARVSLPAPPVAVVEHAPMLEIARFIAVLTPTVEPQQHSPPELYTLHLSLLI